MKIGLFVQRFPGGGAERYVEEIATRLHKDGTDVVVVTSDGNHDDSLYDFKIIRLPSIIRIGEYHIWRGIENVLQQEKFDVIHTNTYGYYHSDKLARLKKKYGYKLVMTSHGFTGMDIHRLKKQKIISRSSSFDFLREIYDKKIGTKTLLLCDHLIALSEYDSDFYKKIGVDESKISIIPPGVSDVFFGESSKLNLKGDPVLLSVGKLSWIKNQKMAIEAMPELLQTKPDAHLYMIGPDGGELESLKRLSKKLGVDTHVLFLGAKRIDEIRDYMRSSDLLLQTSYAEGLSTVLLESAACGLPFITTPAGGNGLFAKECGIGNTVEFDTHDLAKTIEILLNKEKRQDMKSEDKILSSYSWNNVLSKIVTVYEGLLS